VNVATGAASIVEPQAFLAACLLCFLCVVNCVALFRQIKMFCLFCSACCFLHSSIQ